MTKRFPYDRSRSPAAPVLPVQLGRSGGEGFAAAIALVDTGAEITVIPDRMAVELQLPVVGEVTVRGVTGSERVRIYGVELAIDGICVPTEAAGVGTHTLIGRDVINRWTVVLRGPAEMLELETETAEGG